jgi:hypothetical protein
MNPAEPDTEAIRKAAAAPPPPAAAPAAAPDKKTLEKLEREKKELAKKEQKELAKKEKRERERKDKEARDREKREKKEREKTAKGAKGGAPAPATVTASPAQPAEPPAAAPAKPAAPKPNDGGDKADGLAKALEAAKAEDAARSGEPDDDDAKAPAKPAEPLKSEAQPKPPEPAKPEAKPEAPAKPAEPVKVETPPKPAEPVKAETPPKPVEPAKVEAPPKPPEPAKAEAKPETPSKPAKVEAPSKPVEPAPAPVEAVAAPESGRAVEGKPVYGERRERRERGRKARRRGRGTHEGGPAAEPVFETGRSRLGIRGSIGIGGLVGHDPVKVIIGARPAGGLEADYYEYEHAVINGQLVVDDSIPMVYVTDGEINIGASVSGSVSVALLSHINRQFGISCEVQYSFYVAGGEHVNETEKRATGPWILNEASVELHSLEIPLLLRYSPEAASLGYPVYMEAGPQFGFNWNARRTEYMGAVNVFSITRPNLNVFEFGPVVGAGLDLGKLSVGVRAYIGVAEYSEGINNQGDNIGGWPWSLTAGVTSFF